MSKIILSALANASKIVRTLPPVETWGESATCKALSSMPDGKVKTDCINYAKKEYEKINGDNTAPLRAIIDSFAESGVDLAMLKRLLTAATREDIKPPSAISADDCAKAYKSRTGGVALSKVAENLGTSYQNLVIAMRKHMGDDILDRAKKEIEAKANA